MRKRTHRKMVVLMLAKLGEEVGTTAQYVNRLIKKDNSIVNKILVQMLEVLGYDIQLTYVN